VEQTGTPLLTQPDYTSSRAVPRTDGSSPCMHGQTQPPRGFGKLARRGAPLLNQQCWCWGCDVRRPEGNLLLAHGFNRERVPPGKLGSSAYTLRLDRAVVVLWGFGLFWGQASLDGLFLPRQGFLPRLLDDAEPPRHVWDLAQLDAATIPDSQATWAHACRLLGNALQWVAGYEEWVGHTCGFAYRDACVSGWRKQSLPAADMPAHWRSLATGCRQLGRAHGRVGT